ncbi:transcription termination factor MTERF2, chloroplastic-like [Eucalyptus grandis]|uniref:transcription termination factor MTERF2, chloroplastic-like n=1 Tax=Eucalyptus grandis TaxID=71139 RepID=UPI00192EC77E|nr:transcription termination factor MTERF2, chloroplastic-like [Eucalyptus grandis]
MFNVSVKNLFLFAQKRSLATLATLLEPPKSSSSSCSSSPLIDYLVKSLDLPLESAVSISQRLRAHRNGVERADSVVGFLRSSGFGKAQIAKLVTNGPTLLRSNVESNLKPKLEYFREIGLSQSVLLGAIAGNSSFFGRSLNSFYKPQIDFLMKCLRTSTALDIAIKRCSWLLTVDRRYTLEPNIDLLMREGVRFDDVVLLMLYQPKTLVMKVEKMAAFVESVKGLGMEPSSPKFIHGLRVMLSMKESTWREKVENFKSLGWSQEECRSMFARRPLCLALSGENIRRTVDFYLNTASIAREVIVGQPVLLKYSVEKRLRPRHSVITVLQSKGLLKKRNSIVVPFKISEKSFLEKYVMKHLEQVPHLMEIYRASAAA